MSSPFDDVLARAHARLTPEPADPPTAARPLRTIRRGQFLTIRELAARAGVSTKTVVEAELGRTVPRFQTIKALSAALGVAPAEVAEFAAAVAPEEDTEGKAAAARYERAAA